jgi:hypothetical protein
MDSHVQPGAAGDRELWLRASEGDTAAFGELFGRHAKTVYNHLFRRVADWSEAEDLTSAVFLQAWRTRRRVVIDRESALPWLLGVANHVLHNTSEPAPSASGRTPSPPRRRPAGSPSSTTWAR